MCKVLQYIQSQPLYAMFSWLSGSGFLLLFVQDIIHMPFLSIINHINEPVPFLYTTLVMIATIIWYLFIKGTKRQLFSLLSLPANQGHLLERRLQTVRNECYFVIKEFLSCVASAESELSKGKKLFVKVSHHKKGASQLHKKRAGRRYAVWFLVSMRWFARPRSGLSSYTIIGLDICPRENALEFFLGYDEFLMRAQLNTHQSVWKHFFCCLHLSIS